VINWANMRTRYRVVTHMRVRSEDYLRFEDTTVERRSVNRFGFAYKTMVTNNLLIYRLPLIC
jgi:hypothetical protein